MKVALVCVAKNEDNYIDEWLNYYNKLGFDNIFMYQNMVHLKYKYKYDPIF
jgi:phosphosulfolactate synthase (CoM biosynthesis protein A)